MPVLRTPLQLRPRVRFIKIVTPPVLSTQRALTIGPDEINPYILFTLFPVGTGIQPVGTMAGFHDVAGSPRGIWEMVVGRGTPTNPQAPLNGDLLAAFQVDSFDTAGPPGTQIFGVAQMQVYVDGAPAVGRVPCRIAWATMNAAGVLSERWSVLAVGHLIPSSGDALNDIGQAGNQVRDIRFGGVLLRGGTQVVTARQVGWAAATNTKTRTTFDTTTVTLPILAAHVGALIDDLITHGLIGA